MVNKCAIDITFGAIGNSYSVIVPVCISSLTKNKLRVRVLCRKKGVLKVIDIIFLCVKIESRLCTASKMKLVKDNGYWRICSCFVHSIKIHHTNFMSSLCPQGIRNFLGFLVFHTENNQVKSVCLCEFKITNTASLLQVLC
jgi:hypothetical protein